MHSLMGKRLLILGGNPETAALVSFANGLGVTTVVADPNFAAPAKRLAAESLNVNVLDISALERLARAARIDGVLVGVADVLVGSYQELCERLGLPCYATPRAVAAFTSKDGFRQACGNFGILTTPTFDISPSFDPDSQLDIEFPVMVKPVDNGGGVGMHICRDAFELKQKIVLAARNSRSGRILVERYMQGSDMLAYYTFSGGRYYLSALADRFTMRTQAVGSPVCVRAEYPSRHLKAFVRDVDPKLRVMFSAFGLRDGVLNIQFFVENGKFYAYDPGFRLQGEAPHLHIHRANRFDNRRMLVMFSLGQKDSEDDVEMLNDPDFRGSKACTLWVLLRAGRIAEVRGMNELRRLDGVFDVVQRFDSGDIVDDDFIGTERQVFARIYIAATHVDQISAVLSEIAKILVVKDEEGRSMIINDLTVYDGGTGSDMGRS